MSERHEPGPALDKLIAERVMGWRFVQETPGPAWRAPDDPVSWWYTSPVSGMLYRIPPNGPPKQDDFAPSRSLVAAWRVVEQLRAGDYECELYRRHRNDRVVLPAPASTTQVIFVRPGYHGRGSGVAATDAHAICLAALAVMTYHDLPLRHAHARGDDDA